jgi:hypothetical protein
MLTINSTTNTLGAQLFRADGQTEGRTDISKLKVEYRNCLVNEPKKDDIFGICTYTLLDKQ